MRLCVLLAAWLALSGQVCAQGAPKPDKAAEEAAAAKERIERRASNPMRLILEAGKARPKTPEPAAGGVASALANAATAKPAPEPAPVPAPVPVPTLSSGSLQRTPVAEPVAALERSNVPAPVLTAIAPLAAPAPAAAQMAPKLKNMVEPVIPQRVLDAIGRLGDVSVDITIRADGTVAAVAVLAPAPRQAHRYIEAALEQWRFEPLSAQRVHRVQLVFSADR